MDIRPLRNLPALHVLLAEPELAEAIETFGRIPVREAARLAMADVRRALLRGELVGVDTGSLARQTMTRLYGDELRLRPVINATGVLLHTGLGRAPLAGEAARLVRDAVRGYCSLEIDLQSGGRGRRAAGVVELIRRLTGAESAAVVNNNAAATVLALRALAKGREVIVSRGQLVEIGGSFRLPEILEASGARLREVGTTNRTRLSDYESAIGPETAALLRVHTSNYRIVGFTESVDIAALAALGRSRGLWVIDDIGSGALGPGRPPVISGEPTAAEGVSAGADLVLFSGDKLLGGPQCGILAGRSEAVRKVTTDPLMRAVRVDKMTIAALEVTLALALDPEHGRRHIPLWSLLGTTEESLRGRAEALAARLRDLFGLNADVVGTEARLGGGSAPDQVIPSFAARIAPPFPARLGSVQDLARLLRRGRPTVVPRVHAGCILLDLRSVPEADDAALGKAIERLVGSGAPPSGRADQE